MSKGNFYECVGRSATRPFLLGGVNIRIHCIEELCYYISRYAELIDESFESPELIDWISQECGLPELARKLQSVRRQSIMLDSFVREILTYVGYGSEEEIRQACRVIKANRSQSEAEREKALGDYFLRSGRYLAAYDSYEKLIYSTKLALNARQMGSVYHNLGVIYARFFYYTEAAESFLEAHRLSGKENAYFSYLAAKRMELGEVEYLKFLRTLPEENGMIGRVEERIEELSKAYRESEDHEGIRQIETLRLEKKYSDYEREADRLIDRRKEEYRVFLSD